MHTNLANTILNTTHRMAMPIGINAGLEITGVSVRQAVSSAQAQVEAVLALHEAFDTQFMLTAMDLSAEAEAFGCIIRMEEQEVPTVLGRLVTSSTEINQLLVPEAGAARTSIHLQAVHALAQQAGGIPVLGGVIGPFSLASRLFGVSEALLMSLTDPEVLEALVEKATQFLSAYVAAFKEQGAAGVIMAEPSAGLLSPRGLARFSSPFVKQIIQATRSEDFTLVLHNCGAKIAHLPKILEAEAEIYHFGAPMDLPAAIAQVDSSIILSGNLDPASIFLEGRPEEVQQQTRRLLEQTAAYGNFVISSGCDLPPHIPVENIAAFFEAVKHY